MSVQPISTCLNDIIGLSRSSCDCREFPIDSETSKSGLYLDGLPGITLNEYSSIEDCDEGNIWNILNMSRSDAIQAFFADMSTEVLKHYDPYQTGWRGTIGSAKFNADTTPNNAMQGWQLYPVPLRAGSMILRRIGLIFNANANFDVYVYSSEDGGKLLATYNVTTVANKLQWFDLPTPLELPMHIDGYDSVQYFIGYDYVGTYKPKNNKIQDGCNCNFYYNRNSPRWNWKVEETKRWKNFVMVGGMSVATPQDAFKNVACSNTGYGLLLDMQISCNSNQFICDGYDYEGNASSQAISYAIWYKAGSILIDRILASGNIDRYTMLDRERLYGMRNHYSKEYWNRVGWLAENMNVQDSGCYVCKSTMQVRGIMN